VLGLGATSLSQATAQSYNCGSPQTGNVSCNSYLGTIHCNFFSVNPGAGLSQSVACTNSDGKTVYCAPNFLFGFSADCPSFPPSSTSSSGSSSTSKCVPTWTNLCLGGSSSTSTTLGSSSGGGLPSTTGQTYGSGTSTPSTNSYSCTLAAHPPTITVTPAHPGAGPTFVFQASTLDPGNVEMGYDYAYYDSASSVWEAWQSGGFREVSPGASYSFSPTQISGKSRIVITAYSANACGGSSIVWDTQDKTGTVMNYLPIAQNELTQTEPPFDSGYPLSYRNLRVSDLVRESSPAPLIALSFTPTVCEVDLNKTSINLLSVGICDLEINAAQTQTVAASKIRIELSVVAASVSIQRMQYCVTGGASDSVCSGDDSSILYQTCSASPSAVLYYLKGKKWIKVGAFSGDGSGNSTCTNPQKYAFNISTGYTFPNADSTVMKMVYSQIRGKKALVDQFTVKSASL